MWTPEAAGGAELSPELLGAIARYANLDLTPERAALLAPLLAPSLQALRALRPAGYDDLVPAVVVQIPREPDHER